ncbi:hypothetical protein FA13DRAFT_9316 [Coprinellus micaceus]|uniref:Uncharacterized protein n=1 Tax=Coprinellus micaceus TaxID=71717 RepID=A0A4Y7U0H1_COPMI|nr:hypothetical protein FA13DRAFT_852827 [Coprinellus micaceus]TEB39558.1 hypothetical protein FA13DRAFT_9316 [Coprinellus micaceus]
MLSKGRTSSPRGALRTNDELSRILDPSYTSSSHIRASTYGPYVDAQGTLHDPDYRHFPLIQQSSQYSAKRRNTKSSNRPHWELVDEEAGLLTDDEDMLLERDSETGYYAKRNSWTAKPTTSSPRHYSPSRRSSYPPRSSAFSGAILSPADVSPPTSWSSSSAYSQSSSPASTSSSVLQQPSRSSPFEAGSEKSKCRIGSSLGRKRRSSAATALSAEKDAKKAKRTSFDYDDEDYTWYRREEEPVAEVEEIEDEDVVPRDYQTEEDEDEEPRRVEEDGDCVPSCADALKRRWQALSLSIRFGMFRAEKRIKRRVQSLI